MIGIRRLIIKTAEMLMIVLVVLTILGFAVSGATQIMTSIGSSFAGNVFGTVPFWLT